MKGTLMAFWPVIRLTLAQPSNPLLYKFIVGVFGLELLGLSSCTSLGLELKNRTPQLAPSVGRLLRKTVSVTDQHGKVKFTTSRVSRVPAARWFFKP